MPISQKIEQTLLTQIANEAHVDSWKELRWFAVGGENPRSIVIVKRGKKAQTVKTISRTNNPVAWASWQPVLQELQTVKKQTGKRVDHAKLPIGDM